MTRQKNISTIGHSNHSIQDFIQILKNFDIEILADIRHYPGSRHNPQFGRRPLQESLLKNGIEYIHIEELGGRRKYNKDHHENDGWRSKQFRGYADYMQTDEFYIGMAKLLLLANGGSNVVIMCSEAVPWRCHRSMVGDALIVEGFQVIDLFNEKNARPHELTKFAKVQNKKITYPESALS